MMRWGLLRAVRRASVIALVSLFSVFCASAVASDPLLSGYGGPGGGEQVVIGTKVLPAENGDGSLRQNATADVQTSSSPKKADSKRQPAKKDAAKDTSAPLVVDAKPLYPTEASTASAIPLAKGDLAGLLVAAATVGLIAFFFRRSGSPEQ